MLRSLLLAILAAVAGVLAWRALAPAPRPRRGNTERIDIPCGGPAAERRYPGPGTTLVMVKVLRTCGDEARIRIGDPAQEWEDVEAHVMREQERVRVRPEAGSIWFVAVPAGERLRLECPGADGEGCAFELRTLEMQRPAIRLLADTASQCGHEHATRIYNRSGRPWKLRVEWTSVCARNHQPSPPAVLLRPIDPPAAGAPAERSVPPRMGGTPAAEWQGSLDADSTIDLRCGDGSSGECAFLVRLLSDNAADIHG